ncbi:AraC family transcriptional regulator [Flavobacterium sp. SM15]|uniref:helix-turn-helix domain-containing protein n=1 Tax=Flavobacterium sp. SM15 TaxID=2908005 RepID=UPI001EDA87FA|nr:AraC family transcriptional regulator [Flavobacterium sp. SM15]MCG2612225.1 AraC family transcriptional regulator [Flavobacterium sp. SM15]
MNRFVYVKLFYIMLFPLFLSGQSPKKNYSYQDLWSAYFDNVKNVSKKEYYASMYLKKAKSDTDPIFKARAYYLFSLMNKEDTAIKYLDSVVKYSINTNDDFFPISAYCEKAYILKKQFKFREAMNNYLIAEKYALKNKKEDYHKVKFFIGVLKSEDLGEVKEALIMYRECLSFYIKKDIRGYQFSNLFQTILFAIADAHKALKQTDSATYYNEWGHREAIATDIERNKYLFVLNEGANQVLRKNFTVALDSINKALPKMKEYDDKMNTLASYYYLGKAYEGMNQKKMALKNYIKVDSMYKVTNNITPEFLGGYNFLINYYKENGDSKNQLNYLQRLMGIDSVLQRNYKHFYKLLNKEYDIPHLVENKENLIDNLRKDKQASTYYIGGLIFLTIGLSCFGIYQENQKRIFRNRFEKIINKNEIELIGVLNEGKNVESVIRDKTEEIGISDEIIGQILKKLNQFEKDKGYLNSNITIQLLSQEFETNSKYVSKIVNTHKGVSFSQYINDLRVDNAIRLLQQDNKLTKYTISALALEFGFNNAESFSNAFNKKTGIKPSYFIKELIKKNSF